MLIQPLVDKLDHLRLYGLRAALADQLVSAQYADLSFEARLGLLVDAEWTARTNANLKRRLKSAHLHQEASIEDLDMASARGMDRAQLLSLAAGDWITRSLGVIVLGPTGSGKTFVACALGHAACRLDLTVRYERLGRLLSAVSRPCRRLLRPPARPVAPGGSAHPRRLPPRSSHRGPDPRPRRHSR